MIDLNHSVLRRLTPDLAGLHAAVRVRHITAGELELFDTRTGLHLAIDEITVGDRSELGCGCELDSVLGELGLLDDGSPLQDIVARQREWRCRVHRADLDQRLAAALEFAVGQVPYYRSHASAYGRPVAGVADLSQLPLLEKSTLRAGFDQFVADGTCIAERVLRGDWELVSTSGSTGERLSALADMTLPRFPPELEEIWGLPLLDRTRRTAVLTSPGCMGTAGCGWSSLDRAERMKQGFTLFVPTSEDLFSIDDDAVSRIVAELWDFAPDFLLVNPVYAHWIARRASELALELPRVELVLSAYQYASRLQVRAIERLFRAPVRSMYSATELGGSQIGLECGHGNLHAREDHCVVELVDGRVTVTTLVSQAMPLIRYAPGDLAIWSDEECSCPMQAWPVLVLQGREQECLLVRGCQISTRAVDEVVGSLAGIDFYSCHQVGPDRITLDLVPTPGGRPDADEIARRLGRVWCGARVSARIARRLDPAPSAKFPLVSRDQVGMP